MRVLSDVDIAELRSQTLSLVTEVGLRVDHEQVQQLLLSAGCTLSPDGRVRLPASLVADFVALQESRRADEQAAPDRSRHTVAVIHLVHGGAPLVDRARRQGPRGKGIHALERDVREVRHPGEIVSRVTVPHGRISSRPAGPFPPSLSGQSELDAGAR
jgi:trimethylamine:corrinoid methyltransferase-like protein